MILRFIEKYSAKNWEVFDPGNSYVMLEEKG